MINIKDIRAKIKDLPANEVDALLRDLELLEDVKSIKDAREKFIPFVNKMWPGFISGRHHAIMADAFERIANGTLKRLIVNMPPRHTKSEFASYLFPAWFMGQYPHKKIIQTAHTAELAVGFGRKVKNLIDGEDYQKVFPGTKLASDSKAAGRWSTSAKGDYFAIGVGGAVTGKGADVLVIDDPHSEQEAAMGQHNPEIYDKVYEWYTSGPRQRLQPGGAIIIVMTRWSQRDLTGQIIKKSGERIGSDEWEVIEFPAIMPESDLPLWPEFWNLEELLAIRSEIPISKSQHQKRAHYSSATGGTFGKMRIPRLARRLFNLGTRLS